jgi:AcrR family transcriptional regulator
VNEQASARTEARARKQRKRILDAARECFIREGFHAASMASLAATAKMSAGLIYRYFDSKSAIILAIIEEQLEERRANIATLQSDDDLAQRVRDLFSRWRRADPSVVNPALFLEISVEASRDPRIAEALGNADRIAGSEFRSWLTRLAAARGHKLPACEAKARVLLLQVFIEGLATRAVRDPGFDSADLSAALDYLLAMVMSFEPMPLSKDIDGEQRSR